MNIRKLMTIGSFFLLGVNATAQSNNTPTIMGPPAPKPITYTGPQTADEYTAGGTTTFRLDKNGGAQTFVVDASFSQNLRLNGNRDDTLHIIGLTENTKDFNLIAKGFGKVHGLEKLPEKITEHITVNIENPTRAFSNRGDKVYISYKLADDAKESSSSANK